MQCSNHMQMWRVRRCGKRNFSGKLFPVNTTFYTPSLSLPDILEPFRAFYYGALTSLFWAGRPLARRQISHRCGAVIYDTIVSCSDRVCSVWSHGLRLRGSFVQILDARPLSGLTPGKYDLDLESVCSSDLPTTPDSQVANTAETTEAALAACDVATSWRTMPSLTSLLFNSSRSTSLRYQVTACNCATDQFIH